MRSGESLEKVGRGYIEQGFVDTPTGDCCQAGRAAQAGFEKCATIHVFQMNGLTKNRRNCPKVKVGVFLM
jgi:hypothetical protein